MFEMMQKMMAGMQPMMQQFNQEAQDAQGQPAGFPFNMMGMCMNMMGGLPQPQQEPAPKEGKKK